MAHQELSIVICAILGLPFLVLVADYIYRFESSLSQVLQQSGPDLCLLGLGSIGSVFLDKKVASVFFLPPQLAGVVVAVLIFILRGLCLKISKYPISGWTVFGNLCLGSASLTVIGAILVYSYMH